MGQTSSKISFAVLSEWELGVFVITAWIGLSYLRPISSSPKTLLPNCWNQRQKKIKILKLAVYLYTQNILAWQTSPEGSGCCCIEGMKQMHCFELFSQTCSKSCPKCSTYSWLETLKSIKVGSVTVFSFAYCTPHAHMQGVFGFKKQMFDQTQKTWINCSRSNYNTMEALQRPRTLDFLSPVILSLTNFCKTIMSVK